MHFEMETEGLKFRRDLNFEQVRSAVSTASMTVLDPRFLPTFEYQPDLVEATAKRGLLIDAGHLPDKAIRIIGERAADLAYSRAFDHPFGPRPWLLTHTWQSDEGTWFSDWFEETPELLDARVRMKAENPITTHLYLVEPISTERHFGAIVTEYAFVTATNKMPRKVKFLLMPMARITFEHTEPDKLNGSVEGPDWAKTPGSLGSAVNPMLTALLLLNTRGVGAESIAAPKLVNQQRAKKGRGPIPGYTRVLSKDYVTAVIAGTRRKSAAEPGAEKRRSPIPHLRRGHIRTYASGEQTWIRDMLVGAKDEAELAWAERHRAGYKLKEAPSA